MRRKAVVRGFFLCLFAVLIMSADLVLPDSKVAVDRVVVDKHDRQLTLMVDGEPYRSYRVSLGFEPDGHKQQQGDGRTPEGTYILDYKNSGSAFYRSIHISYPNARDRARARRAGVKPGGDIMIHGQKNGFGWLGFLLQYFDWTAGCIAVTNRAMDDIWRLVSTGTPIEIRP
jgi:murein L,D-transpeptidase YafK